MIQGVDKIREYQAANKKSIVDSFVDNSSKIAQPITKGDFDASYPLAEYERYSLSALDNFRKDLSKAESVENKVEAFQKATSDLRAFIVHHEGKIEPYFIRKKVTGEK